MDSLIGIRIHVYLLFTVLFFHIAEHKIPVLNRSVTNIFDRQIFFSTT